MQREALETWLEEGLSLEQIARRVRKHPSTVGYWAKKYGLTSPHAERHAARGGIPRETLEELVARGLTIREVAAELDRSTSTIRHWLRRHGLSASGRPGRRARHPAAPGAPRDAQLRCPRHGVTPHRRFSDRGYRCLRCRVEYVARRRRKVKAILVAEAGGACVLCGYDKVASALHFHHVDPSSKAFNIAYRGSARSLERAREEARKCVLLCGNCHAEVEAGVATLP